MSIVIDRVSVIKLEPNEKLLVKVPDTVTKDEWDETRKSLLNFFGITPNRLLMYQGDVGFKKVQG